MAFSLWSFVKLEGLPLDNRHWLIAVATSNYWNMRHPPKRQDWVGCERNRFFLGKVGTEGRKCLCSALAARGFWLVERLWIWGWMMAIACGLVLPVCLQSVQPENVQTHTYSKSVRCSLCIFALSTCAYAPTLNWFRQTLIPPAQFHSAASWAPFHWRD